MEIGDVEGEIEIMENEDGWNGDKDFFENEKNKRITRSRKYLITDDEEARKLFNIKEMQENECWFG